MAKRITFVHASFGIASGGDRILSVSASVVATDLLIVLVTTETVQGDPTVTGGGTGTWTKLTGAAGGRQTIWWKRAGTAAPGDITVSGVGNDSSVYAAFRGVREVVFSASLQTDVGGSNTSTGTLPAPPQPWAWVVLCLSYSGVGVTVTAETATNPSAVTHRAQTELTTFNTTSSIAAAEQTSFAASGAISWTLDWNGHAPGDVSNLAKTAFYLLPQVEIIADTRSYALTGRPVFFVEDNKLRAETRAFVLSGANVGLIVGGRLSRAILGNPAWSRDASIGEVGGSLTKEDSKTEGHEPSPAMWLREIRAMRGSIYTTKPATLVHVENVMMARLFGAVWSRTPEKFRANLSPARADERLRYWVEYLSIPVQPGEPKQTIRSRASAHYRIANGPTLAGIRTAVSELLGDAFVDVVYTPGASLSAPPANTYWPGVNPGPGSHDLGNGTWTSPRAHIVIQVRRPPGMTNASFTGLVNVQLHQLLDRMLPARNTFAYDEV